VPQLSNLMLLIAYTPREDSHQRGYHDWLREVDNPFFNSVEGIVHYTNWKVDRSPVGASPFTHFDLLFVDPDVGVERTFGNPEVQAFASGWNDLWGTHPEGTFADSGVHVYSCSPIAEPPEVERSENILLLPYTPRPDARDGGYDEFLREVDNPFFNSQPEVVSYTNWLVTGSLAGEPRFSDFDLFYVNGADGWEQFLANPAIPEFATGWMRRWAAKPEGTFEENFFVASCSLIASPDRVSV
jgi:hypothetical protein